MGNLKQQDKVFVNLSGNQEVECVVHRIGIGGSAVIVKDPQGQLRTVHISRIRIPSGTPQVTQDTQEPTEEQKAQRAEAIKKATGGATAKPKKTKKDKAIEALPPELKDKVKTGVLMPTPVASTLEIGKQVHEAVLDGKTPTIPAAKAIVQSLTVDSVTKALEKAIAKEKAKKKKVTPENVVTSEPVATLLQAADDMANESKKALDALKGKTYKSFDLVAKSNDIPKIEPISAEVEIQVRKKERSKLTREQRAERNTKVKEALLLGIKNKDIADATGADPARISDMRKAMIASGEIVDK